jgi:hypothetical protein
MLDKDKGAQADGFGSGWMQNPYTYTRQKPTETISSPGMEFRFLDYYLARRGYARYHLA